MSESLLYLAAFVILISVGVSMSIIAVRRDGRGVGELLKQLVIWLGIVGLLPLVGYAGATILHPRTTMEDLESKRTLAQQEASNTQDAAERTKHYNEASDLTKQIDEETRLFNRSMFWVAFPLGLAAIIVGVALVRVVAVGTGLAFGGLCTLSFGCYSYWDGMGDYLRFFSLLIALLVLIALGFGRPTSLANRQTIA